MRIRTCPAALFFIMMLAGCAETLTSIHGNIYSLSSPLVLPMEIEMTQSGGWIRATNPETGEAFSGQYAGVRESVSAPGIGPGGWLPYRRITVTRQDVPATATMVGNRGTVLYCRMRIQAAQRPTGMGECTDNHGGTYSLMF